MTILVIDLVVLALALLGARVAYKLLMWYLARKFPEPKAEELVETVEQVRAQAAALKAARERVAAENLAEAERLAQLKSDGTASNKSQTSRRV